MLRIGKLLGITFVLESLARGTGARKPEQFGHESKRENGVGTKTNVLNQF